ncbi:VOC family protein [Hyalangium rubrum]|uniref:VOC family protein n=1 Tax=Hyalangium rubrum TaxID=3103134 RepID=A0ABU5H359_9BACT|nr:VOC family protein [Hyalangium sp. s54d21]MDY7227903.1 VOC family protein [Hyalangium sp. s54d21]
MSKSALPGFTRVDHVALTVPDLDKAVEFYTETFGATELFRLGPFDAAELPRMPDGRDWTEAHVNVPGARVFLAMLQLGPTLKLELFRYELPKDARTTPPRNCDLGGHHIAFQVENLEAAVAYLRARELRVMAGPIVIPVGPAAGMRTQYVLDPWGNQLELVELPKR